MPKLADLLSFWRSGSTPFKYWIKYFWSGSTHILYYIKLSLRWNTLLRNQISSCQHVYYYTKKKSFITSTPALWALPVPSTSIPSRALRRSFGTIQSKLRWRQSHVSIFKCTSNDYYRDTQHNDIQHNDTQHKGFICDTRHNNAQPLGWVSLCWESHFIYQMLNVIILSVIMLNVIMLNVVMLSVVMLSVVAPTMVNNIAKCTANPPEKICPWPITPPPPNARETTNKTDKISTCKKASIVVWPPWVTRPKSSRHPCHCTCENTSIVVWTPTPQMEQNLFVLHHA